MTVGHLSFLTPSLLGRLTHHTFGFIDAAQGFVAFSGLVIGLVYGKRLLQGSVDAMRSALRSRMRILWLWMAGLTLLVAALVPFLPDIPDFLAARLGDNPLLAAFLSLGLLSGLWGVDVLAAYLVFMALTPAALIAMRNGRWGTLTSISIAAWFLGQIGLPDAALNWLTIQLGIQEHGLSLGLYFNRLGWQVLYFGGLALGFQIAQKRLKLDFIRRPVGHRLLIPSLALIAVFYAGSFALIFGPRPIAPELRVFLALFDRQDMTLLRLSVFGAYIYVGLWLLICGPEARILPVRALARGLHAVGTWPPLVFLGQHSLQVFAWHAILVYVFAAYVAPPLRGLPLLFHELAIGLAAASLWIPAAIHARHNRHASRRLVTS